MRSRSPSRSTILTEGPLERARMEPRFGKREPLADAAKTAGHPRRVMLRIPGSRDTLAVGAREPMRLVAPFGYSSAADFGIDLERHVSALAEAGADAVQELSTTGPYRSLRPRICANIGIPYGTVLAYEYFDRLRKVSVVTEAIATQLAVEILEEQCALGLSYSTIHAALSRRLLASTEKSRRHRAIAVPSRSAAMLMTLMRRHRIDNPFFLAWPELVRILRKYDVAASMGSSLRPAAISDALDHAHRAEIAEQGVLVSYAHNENVHVLIEGLSHALPDDIAEYVALVDEYCEGAPATALGPLPIDIAAGRDDIAAVPGIVFGRLAGLSLVNVITSKEHLAMPSTEDMVEALRASRVAVYIADAIQVGRRSARDRLMSEAREALNWNAQAQHALFPDLVTALSPAKQGQPCTICASRCPHLIAKNRPATVRASHRPLTPVASRPPSLRAVLEAALEPLGPRVEVIWFGSLAQCQQDAELDLFGLAGSDVDLTLICDDPERTYELLEETLRKISVRLAQSSYGSHISLVSESPGTFLKRLEKRPDLWNAIWRDGIPLGSSDSILSYIRRDRVRRVGGDLVVRYAVRSLELAVLQIALAAMAHAPGTGLSQILRRKLEGALWPLAHAIGSFSEDKELSRRSVLAFLGDIGLPDLGADAVHGRLRLLDHLLRITHITLAEAKVSASLTAQAQARVDNLGRLIHGAVTNWPNFRLPTEAAHSMLYDTGPQYAFLEWAFLQGGMVEIFEQPETDHVSV